jgi:hypothetical protein
VLDLVLLHERVVGVICQYVPEFRHFDVVVLLDLSDLLDERIPWRGKEQQYGPFLIRRVLQPSLYIRPRNLIQRAFWLRALPTAAATTERISSAEWIASPRPTASPPLLILVRLRMLGIVEASLVSSSIGSCQNLE